jgi:hypothetical protein
MMMLSMRKGVRTPVSAALFGILVALALPACSGKEANEPAVATPSLALNRERVPIGSPVKLTYKFQVLPGGSFDGDYWVFVHILDPDGEQLWTDDHLPPTPTSKWKPGDTVEYTRTVFAPNYPYIGEANIRLGIYSQQTSKRLVLNAQEVSRREYLVGKFHLQPQNENIYLIYREGWHTAEVAAENPASEWQWTKKAATISFKNPKKDVTFYLEYDARTDLFTPPQQAVLKVNGQEVATFAADSRERKLLTFPISAVQLGAGDMAEIGIELDKTFKPEGGDTRELGIRIFHAFVEPK